MRKFPGLFALLLALLFGFSAFAADPSNASKKTRVLLVVGGHGFQTNDFYKVFHNNPQISVEIREHPNAHAMLTAEAAKNWDVLVLYDYWQKITEEAKADLVARLKEGKGLVALHHCIANYQTWPEYAKIIGAAYYTAPRVVNGVEKPRSQPKHDVDFTVKIADPNHPITRGLKDFAIHDETYRLFDIDPGVHTLLTTEEPSSSPIIGWTKTYEAARVVYLELGHDRKAYENPAFPTLLARSIQWVSTPGAQDSRCYELRTYYAAEGKLDALNARFRNHTCKLFEKHGIANIGYWMPIDNPDNKLVYLIAFPSREARAQSWKQFGADPAWKAVVQETEANGKLVTKVDSVLLSATDFSPTITVSSATDARVFELRTYTATAGKLPNLLSRFRDHTCKLFEKHGMSNFGYWVPMDAKQGADNTLIYLLAHSSVEAGKASFAAFRTNPEWIAAKSASEQNGSLTVSNGVQSVYMRPTDYSQTK